jgi:sulfite reductase (NADPH) flavoprotein alpha-component
MTLYFGSRYRAKEYLYGEELDAFAADGLVTLRLAFSRDAGSKCYIQHLMAQDGAALAAALDDQTAGAFYLCGPTWPEPDVEAAIAGAFVGFAGLTPAQAAARITALKAAKRYVLEVY